MSKDYVFKLWGLVLKKDKVAKKEFFELYNKNFEGGTSRFFNGLDSHEWGMHCIYNKLYRIAK
jgi:hypothetical protein